jgi:hypothetical protein
MNFSTCSSDFLAVFPLTFRSEVLREEIRYVREPRQSEKRIPGKTRKRSRPDFYRRHIAFNAKT